VSLAIFDLDNTLLAGDSDYLWGQFLCERGIVDAQVYEGENERFYKEYLSGSLDIYAFLAFQLRPLAQYDMATLHDWHAQFMAEKIRPIILPQARALLQKHRAQGDTLLIITATNRFITAPIAAEFGVEQLLATDLELCDGRYTGRVSGTPCFREGKVVRLREWLEQQAISLKGSWFYSDSHNDLPLLQLIDHPVAVDADAILAAHAERHGWPNMSLR